jgi:hypothetical protein
LKDFERLSKTLTVFGILWQTMADFDKFWQILADFGSLWQTLAVFGRLWQTLALMIQLSQIHGSLWLLCHAGELLLQYCCVEMCNDVFSDCGNFLGMKSTCNILCDGTFHASVMVMVVAVITVWHYL